MHYNFIQITVFGIFELRLKNYPLQNRDNLKSIIENLAHSGGKYSLAVKIYYQRYFFFIITATISIDN